MVVVVVVVVVVGCQGAHHRLQDGWEGCGWGDLALADGVRVWIPPKAAHPSPSLPPHPAGHLGRLHAADSVWIQPKAALLPLPTPQAIKAFYMRLNEDGKTVAAMDVLVPKASAQELHASGASLLFKKHICFLPAAHLNQHVACGHRRSRGARRMLPAPSSRLLLPPPLHCGAGWRADWRQPA